jgi:hypothetical protein
MKRAIIGLSMLLVTLHVASQGKWHDLVAIVIVDRMADVIGDMVSCSFKLHTIHDVADPTACNDRW